MSAAAVHPSPPADQPARDRIRHELDSTLFVEAGAGSGKTSALVDRIVELVATGTATIGEIAAITFTEAAAGELRDRVRESLEQLAADGGGPPAGTDGNPARSEGNPPAESSSATDEEARRRAERAAEAVAHIDGASLSTLHAFAQRLLTEHPLAAGLPPHIAVEDALGSAVAMAERWDSFLHTLLDDPDLQEAVVRLVLAGADLGALAEVATSFNENWDLLEDHHLPATTLGPVRVDSVLDRLDEATRHLPSCIEPDALSAHLTAVGEMRSRLAAAEDDLARLELLRDLPSFRCRLGRADNWRGRAADIKSALAAADDERVATLNRVARGALAQVLAALAELTLTAADQRRRDGHLEFHDLLVLARRLLREHPQIVGGERRRLRHLLIDEFQDTDPIQAELALRLAAAPGADPQVPWLAQQPVPGSLFFVGDPKQAIYRFRRADIELFLTVRDEVVGDAIQLTTNFRSVPGILAWVNAVFGDLFGAGLDTRQPAYLGLDAARPSLDDQPVLVVGEAHESASADDIRRIEAEDLAATIEHLAADDVGFSDIAILVPTRTSVGALEDALGARGIPLRLEASSLVYQTPEVRSLVDVLRAVDDPTDEISVVTTLRSASFACGDDDLVAWFDAGGRWDYTRPVPTGLAPDHPVAVAMAELADLHQRRWWSPVSELIEHLLAHHHLFEAGLDGPRPRDSWRRLRFVADQARAFAQEHGGDLRRWLAWVDQASRDDARVVEHVLPESDDEAVRVLTIHASKGLQFPVVLLAGLQRASTHRPGRTLWGPDGPEVRVPLRGGRDDREAATANWAQRCEHEAQMEQLEQLRLLYVAATRARDRLVVSVHRRQGTECSAEVLAERCADHQDLWAQAPPDGADLDDAGDPARPVDRPTDAPVDAVDAVAAVDPRGPHSLVTHEPVEAEHRDDPAHRQAWVQAWHGRMASMRQPRSVAPSALGRLLEEHHDRPSIGNETGATPPATPEVPEPPDDLEPNPERPPWRRGRGATALGRAVHATLQVVDLTDPADLDSIAAAQAAAEDITGRAQEVARLARHGLDAPIVREAAGGVRSWRELYVGAPVGDRLVEGYIDLLVERADASLAVVDYKTTSTTDPAALEIQAHGYGLQGAGYAVALETALGRPVDHCVFVFLTPSGAHEHWVDDLEHRKTQVRTLLGSRARADIDRPAG